MSRQDINFVPCPMRFSCPPQDWYRENKSLRENLQVKMFAMARYHADVCDAFILNENTASYNSFVLILMSVSQHSFS